MAYIGYVDFFKAQANWHAVCASSEMFDRFIGVHFGDTLKNIDYIHGNMYFNVSSEVAEKFNMLNGPHYKTIIKAYLIMPDEEL